MREKGWTQVKTAQALGVSISRVEYVLKRWRSNNRDEFYDRRKHCGSAIKLTSE